MPAIEWTEGERKAFWRMARTSAWTALVVVAILFATNLVALVGGGVWGIILFLIYACAIWVVAYKILRTRWPA